MRPASWLIVVTVVPAAALAILGGCEVVADLGRYGSEPLADRPEPPPDTSCNACGARCCPAGSTCLDNAAGTCSHDIVEVSAGTESSCAVLADGTLWCWGGNQFGTLGFPPGSDSACVNGGLPVACSVKPVQVKELTEVAHVSSGWLYTCAIKRDHSVWCWGKNAYGVLGHEPGTSDDRLCPSAQLPDASAELCNPTPQRVSDLAASEISTGMFHVCALQLDGSVACWGSNVKGELGDPDASAARATPGVVRSLPPSAHVATGMCWHSCAVAADGGGVWCWGNGSHGELGHPEELDKDCQKPNGEKCLPMPVSTPVAGEDGGTIQRPLDDVVDVRTGFLFSCALHRSGQVFCWGDEMTGTVGKPTDAGIQRAPVPMPMPGLAPARKIDARFQHACALLENGSVACWGDNTLGEMGVGHFVGGACGDNSSGTVQKCQHDAGLALVKGPSIAIATGVASSFALSDDHRTIWGWGSMDPGRLGRPPEGEVDNTNCGDQLTSVCNAHPRPVTPFP